MPLYGGSVGTEGRGGRGRIWSGETRGGRGYNDEALNNSGDR